MLTKINQATKRRKGQRGFTLIELLLVVAILAVLAFLAVPAIASTIRNARIRTSASNEIMIEQAMWRWYADSIALGVAAPFAGSGLLAIDGSLWQTWDGIVPGSGAGVTPVIDAVDLLDDYFRPSTAPTCPFGGDDATYQMYVLIGEGGILEDVLVICDNVPGMHERAAGRPEL